MRPPNPSMADEIIITITSWYDQKLNYDFAAGKAKAGKPDSSVLAFTALVWKHTTKIGIGATRKSDGYIYIVVQFSPAGNVGGEFVNNVLEYPGGQLDVMPITHDSMDVSESPPMEIEIVSPDEAPKPPPFPIKTKPFAINGSGKNLSSYQ